MPPPTVFDLGVPPRDFVASRILLPTQTTVHMLGVDFNGDGNVDNALGSILGALSGMGAMDLQYALDSAVASGLTLILLRLQARSYTSSPVVQAWTWVGQSQPCSAKTCFGGSHSFPTVPGTQSPFTGRIQAGRVYLGPAKLRFRFAIGAGKVMDLTLKSARVHGDVTDKFIKNGVLAGAITRTDLKTQVIPAVAQLLQHALDEPSTPAQTRDTIKVLFDANKDGMISAGEVAQNSIIKTFLAGDVDVDGDGEMELSLGLGFEAVRARIQ